MSLCRALDKTNTPEEIGSVLETAVRKTFERKLAPALPQVLTGHLKAQDNAPPAKPRASRPSWMLERPNHEQHAYA